MSKDRLKEEIGLYKLLMTITSAISSSLIGWIYNNIAEIFLIEVVIISVTILSLLAATFFFLYKINTKIGELRYD